MVGHYTKEEDDILIDNWDLIKGRGKDGAAILFQRGYNRNAQSVLSHMSSDGFVKKLHARGIQTKSEVLEEAYDRHRKDKKGYMTINTKSESPLMPDVNPFCAVEPENLQEEEEEEEEVELPSEPPTKKRKLQKITYSDESLTGVNNVKIEAGKDFMEYDRTEESGSRIHHIQGLNIVHGHLPVPICETTKCGGIVVIFPKIDTLNYSCNILRKGSERKLSIEITAPPLNYAALAEICDELSVACLDNIQQELETKPFPPFRYEVEFVIPIQYCDTTFKKSEKKGMLAYYFPRLEQKQKI